MEKIRHNKYNYGEKITKTTSHNFSTQDLPGCQSFLPFPFLLPITPRASLLSQERRLGTSQSIRVLLNLVPRIFSLSNMAAAGEKTLAHSELKRSLIGTFHCAFIRELSLVYSFQNKKDYPLSASWRLRSAFFSV